MAPTAHSPGREAEITRACSDVAHVDRTIKKSPILVMREEEARFHYRMTPVDCWIDGYTMAIDKPTQLLVVYDPSGTIIGGITHKRIGVLPEDRGQGIGAEILIRAFESGVMHPDTMNSDNLLTTAGRANRAAAHRIAVALFERGLTSILKF
jgi:GNAT superfamily N-acetyltransferase